MINPKSVALLGLGYGPKAIALQGFIIEVEIIVIPPNSEVYGGLDGQPQTDCYVIIINIKYGTHKERRYFKVPFKQYTKVITALENAIVSEMKILCSILGENENRIRVTTRWIKNGTKS